MIVINWENMRRNRYAIDEPPPEWPKGVRAISTEGLSLFGIDHKGALYWDGEILQVRGVLTFGQKIWVGFVSFCAVVAALAAVVQAIPAWKTLVGP